VNFIRLDLTNARFATDATITATIDGVSVGNPVEGGAGAGFVLYSYTAPGPILQSASVTVSATKYKPINKETATAQYRLYNDSVEASAPSNKILGKAKFGEMWKFAPSYTFSSDLTGTNTSSLIDVSQGSRMFTTTPTTIGKLTIKDNAGVLLAGGTAVSMVAGIDVVNATTTATRIKVSGDMTGFGSIMAFSDATCSTPVAGGTGSLIAGGAFFDIGNTEWTTGAYICVTAMGTTPMNGGEYSATYLPTAVDANYIVSASSELPMQKLIKNGRTFKVLNLPGAAATQDQFFIRIYNTGSDPANILATVFNQDGTPVGTAGATLVSGLAANTVYIVDLAKLETAIGGTIGGGRAWARLEAESTNISVALMLRNVTSNVLVNASASVMEEGQ
jgi:hypothetical protein